MDDAIKILFNNFHEFSRLAQRYIIQSIGSSLLLLILVTCGGGLFKIPFIEQEVHPFLATLIFLKASILFAAMTISMVNKAKIIWGQLKKVDEDGKKKIAHAAITYSSVITSSSRFGKMGAAILTFFILIASYIIESQRQLNTSFWQVLGFTVLSIPFFILAYKLYDPLLMCHK